MVTVCYEHLTAIRDTAPQDGFVSFGPGRELTADQAVAGGIARLILYETSFAVFDVLEIPVWGRIEEAADNVTALIMLDFGEELAWTTILGSAWYLAQRGMLGTGFFSDAARPLEAQRFYNYLCFAYGAQPKTYEFLVNGFNLPPERARLCREEFFKLRRAFRATFMRHVDRATARAREEAQELAAAMSAPVTASLDRATVCMRARAAHDWPLCLRQTAAARSASRHMPRRRRWCATSGS